MPREGHGSRNLCTQMALKEMKSSCPARGMGVEISLNLISIGCVIVMPREGHGSRNIPPKACVKINQRHAPRGAWE